MDEKFNELLDEKGQIRHERVDDLLVEVISGRYLFNLEEPPFALFASRCPTPAEQDKARIVYARKLREAQNAGVMLRVDLEALAVRNDLFKNGEREEKNSLMGMMKRQVLAREKSHDDQQKAQLSVEIEISRKRIVEIEMDEYKVLQHSAESKAEDYRTSFFVSCCTLTGEMLDEPVWPSWADYLSAADWTLAHEARAAFGRVNSGLPIKIIRALARSHEWRIRWKGSKESGSPPFDSSAMHWDRNKVNLIYWSDFYDNIYQHPDCPDDETVNNDEWLQGWLNGQIHKRNQQRSQAPNNPNRKAPTYIDGAHRRKQMTKVGADQVIRVGTPYKVRV